MLGNNKNLKNLTNYGFDTRPGALCWRPSGFCSASRLARSARGGLRCRPRPGPVGLSGVAPVPSFLWWWSAVWWCPVPAGVAGAVVPPLPVAFRLVVRLPPPCSASSASAPSR